MKVLTVSQIRAAEENAVLNGTFSYAELMLNAGRAAADIITKKYNVTAKRVAVVCGSGNNAGDGYALSCILAEGGIKSTLIRVSEKFSDDGKYYYDMAMSKGGADSTDIDLGGYDIVVDCLLGTGFCGEPRGKYADAIRAINKSGAYVISADINSGMNGDTGEYVLAVKSDLTVSIGYYKTGMFLGGAPSLIGDLVNVDIGIVLI